MTLSLALGALLTLGAGLLLLPPADRLPRHLRRPTPGLPAPFAAGFAVASGFVGILVLLDGTTLVLGLILLGSAADVLRRTRRVRLRRIVDRERERVLVVCEAMAADIRAGVMPVDAVAAAAESWPPLEAVARSARLGGDVPLALRSLATRPGAEPVTAIAAAWAVAHRTGAPMASTLDLAAATLRDDRAVAAVVATEIASARATAVLLALLPAGVLLLGQGIGGDAIGFLLATPLGLVCLAGGLLLAHAGLAWMDWITDGMRS